LFHDPFARLSLFRRRILEECGESRMTPELPEHLPAARCAAAAAEGEAPTGDLLRGELVATLGDNVELPSLGNDKRRCLAGRHSRGPDQKLDRERDRALHDLANQP